ncbi:MAG: hypothetical protein ACM3SR_18570 [Ignavibacteriales bacterium]
MISIEEAKKLLGDPNVSDEEAEEIRDACYALAELALEVFRSSKGSNVKERRGKSLKADKNSSDIQKGVVLNSTSGVN